MPCNLKKIGSENQKCEIYSNEDINDIGYFNKLPGGEGGIEFLINCLKFLDSKSVLQLLKTGIFKKNIFQKDKIYTFINGVKYKLLIERYKRLFPHGTPFVCACQKGRLEDVNQFLNLHRFHAYIDVGTANPGMDVTAMVSEVGRNSRGSRWTPLMAAASSEHFQIVKYLIEQGEADPNIVAHSDGWNALHLAAMNNENDTKVIEFLLTNMSLNSINKKSSGWYRYTPLDYAYDRVHFSIKHKIINLIRSKGGKANCHDKNGKWVGYGKGDLNH